MISVKCDKCKNKAWCWSCDKCQSKPFQYFICNEIITYREKNNHMVVHFDNPNKYLVCRMSKVNKHISQYRFKHFYCRLCIYLHRYRFYHTKERFLEHAKKYNIHEAGSEISKAGFQIHKVVSPISEAVSLIHKAGSQIEVKQ